MAVVAMLLGLLRVLSGEWLAEGGGSLTSVAAAAAVVLVTGAVAGALVVARTLGARAPHECAGRGAAQARVPDGLPPAA